MNRRKFIQNTGLSIASVIVSKPSWSALSGHSSAEQINYPAAVSAIINNVTVQLQGNTSNWTHDNVQVKLVKQHNSLAVEIQAPGVQLSGITLLWNTGIKTDSLVLNDQWERSYGDLSWHPQKEAEIFPWYFMEYDGKRTNGFGVKTGATAFCYWMIADKTLRLHLDTLSGGEAVQLGSRTLKGIEIVVINGRADESPFATTRRFTKKMCEKPLLPSQPVYGINDWYYTYGANSDELILKHTQLMAPMAEGLNNRPFSIIDAGWYKYAKAAPGDGGWGDRMDVPNSKFKDMSRLAADIKKMNWRPGLWTRPLCGSEDDPGNIMLPLIKGREAQFPILDPTIPENLERVKQYFKTYNGWGYELVKFDYTSDDIFGKWGFEMIRDKSMTAANWRMNDNSKTNAEIILQLYKTIREAAGKTYIIGCNTFSHLSAGLFEINRIGDDTSGREWQRVRKMGVNTLAFRGLTHGTFYAADGDCVGLTTHIEWDKNKQWMELLGKSGMPLLISAQPEAVGQAQKETIKECFKTASSVLPVGEPLDWMETPFPKKWKLNNKVENFEW